VASCSAVCSPTFFENFRACAHPEMDLARGTTGKKQSENCEQPFVLLGASNLRHSVAHFADPDFAFENVTILESPSKEILALSRMW
jgi:hypothetical protein